MTIVLPLGKKKNIWGVFPTNPFVWKWDHMPQELSSSMPNLTIINGALSQLSWVNLAVSVGTMAMLLLPVGQSIGMTLRKRHIL